MVTKPDIQKALIKLGIQSGDTVLFHSSLKSFGRVDNGADDVIDAFCEVVGESGTVVVPTLAMKNFNDAYRTWSLDKPSDTGLITEVFRKRPNAFRSDQATHSVAAIGEKAEYLTRTHGQKGLRYGVYGDSPFAKDSPWQKLYDMNAAVVMVGIDFEYFTLRHLCEYILVDRGLQIACQHGKYDDFIKYICSFEDRHLRCETLFWPYLDHVKFEKEIHSQQFCKEAICGNAVLFMVRAKDVCDYFMNSAWDQPNEWFQSNAAKWYEEVKRLQSDD